MISVQYKQFKLATKWYTIRKTGYEGPNISLNKYLRNSLNFKIYYRHQALIGKYDKSMSAIAKDILSV